MKLTIYAFLLLGGNLALAQYSTPPQGEYVTDGGWGSLSVYSGGKFRVDTMGPNGHSCSLDGVIANGKSVIDKTTCEVSFKAQGQNIEVGTNESAECRMFCGMRASFDSLYVKPPPPCLRGAMKKSRENFKKNYLTKNYTAALEAISGIATQCKPFLDWIESAWVLNDLALTQFKLGDRAACIRTLKNLSADAAMSDEEIRGTYPPTDADMYLPVVRATRTNLKLCSKK